MLWSILLFCAMAFAIWRMWRERRGTYVSLRDPAFDRSEGDVNAAEALEHIENGNWDGLSALYGRLPPSDRFHLIQAMGRLAPDDGVAWPETDDGAIMTIRAGVVLGRAWASFKPPTSRSAARSALGALNDRLEEARKLLADATIRNPHDSVNLTLQLQIETALRGDTAAVNNLLGRIDATGEHNIFAAAIHLEFVSPKAFGSIGEMWETANHYATNPPNAAWLAIAARAHIEEWLYCMHVDRSLAHDYIAKMQDDGFADHVRSMNRLFWNAADDAPMSPAEARYAHNNFAFLLQMMRLDDLLADHLRAIGPHITADPWRYLPEGAQRPTRLLVELRRKAGLPDLAAAGA